MTSPQEARETRKLHPFSQDKEVFKDLDPIYTTIFNKAATHLAKGRWYNLWHTVLSVDYMKRILNAQEKKGEKVDRHVLIPAIILHDSGWDPEELGRIPAVIAKFPDLSEMHTNWSDPIFRMGHMQGGIAIAHKVLSDIQYQDYLAQHGEKNPEGEIREIYRIVGTHDVGWGSSYLEGKADESQNGLYHRDADACFIVSGVSFWKDYMVAREKARQKGQAVMTPRAYAKDRLQKYGERATEEGRKIFLEELKKREKEIKQIETGEKTIDFWYDEYHTQALARNERALTEENYL